MKSEVEPAPQTSKRHPTSLSIAVDSPQHDDTSWHELDIEIRDAVPVQDDFTCPNLDAACSTLLRGIMAGEIIGAEKTGIQYRDLIEQHGGVTLVVQELLQHVDENIRQLEDRKLTRQALDCVRTKQTEPWPKMVGYMDYITDCRLHTYFRPYVGQSGDGFRRVMQNHVRAILEAQNKSLHYFIMWIGNGARTANFLRLWAFPDNTIQDEWYSAKSDVLELLFCIFFNALPERCIAKKTFDRSPGGCWGLNVMTPLYQHKNVSEVDKSAFIRAKAESLDPQIRL